MDLSFTTIVLHLFTIALVTLTTSAAAFPNLIGQIVSSKSYRSLAIFKKGERIYSKNIGEKVDGYWVSHIEYRYVHLTDENGKTHSIRVGSAAAPTEVKTEEAKMPGIEKTGDQVLMTRQLRDHVSSENLLTVMMQAASEPYYEVRNDDYVLVGFRIFEIEPDSIYDIAGIQNGDVITHIEGVRLDGPLTAINMLRVVRELDSFTFTYLRNGISRETYVDIVF